MSVIIKLIIIINYIDLIDERQLFSFLFFFFVIVQISLLSLTLEQEFVSV